MSRLVGGDRYDAAALACVVIGVVIAVAIGPWYLWLLVGFAVGNLLSAALRRRAGVPDRSALRRRRGERPGPARAEERPPARPRPGRPGAEWREGRRRPR